MRLLTVAAAFLSISTASAFAAQELELPATLLGAWESDPANCNKAEPEGGVSLVLDPAEIQIINNDTEGRSCAVAFVEGEGRLWKISANCGAEESEGEAELLFLDLSPDQSHLALRTESEQASGQVGQEFGRCP